MLIADTQGGTISLDSWDEAGITLTVTLAPAESPHRGLAQGRALG